MDEVKKGQYDRNSQTVLNLGAKFKADIRKMAEEEDRTLNAQIVRMLREHINHCMVKKSISRKGEDEK